MGGEWIKAEIGERHGRSGLRNRERRNTERREGTVVWVKRERDENSRWISTGIKQWF